MTRFQSTHPMRGATVPGMSGKLDVTISIHAPHAGCDEASAAARGGTAGFQSTHPMRGATPSSTRWNQKSRFQSTHPMRGATGLTNRYLTLYRFQSTHPMRGATDSEIFYKPKDLISIHAPHAGCDRIRQVRGDAPRDFNPRTPCGVRRRLQISQCLFLNFNPRTPCGVRLSSLTQPSETKLFQSTHPMRGATAGSPSPRCSLSDFNPRTPCGVRPGALHKELRVETFQSTHPMRGATQWEQNLAQLAEFQSTHPMRGATACPLWTLAQPQNFNPRTPCGVRQQILTKTILLDAIICRKV